MTHISSCRYDYIDMTHIDMSLEVESEAELVLDCSYHPQILRDFTTRYADII